MANEISARVADSEFGRVVLDALRFITKAQHHGLTESELGRVCRSFRALRPSERDQVFSILTRDDEANWEQKPSQSGRGKGRHALVATEFINCNNCDTTAT